MGNSPCLFLPLPLVFFWLSKALIQELFLTLLLHPPYPIYLQHLLLLSQQSVLGYPSFPPLHPLSLAALIFLCLEYCALLWPSSVVSLTLCQSSLGTPSRLMGLSSFDYVNSFCLRAAWSLCLLCFSLQNVWLLSFFLPFP